MRRVGLRSVNMCKPGVCGLKLRNQLRRVGFTTRYLYYCMVSELICESDKPLRTTLLVSATRSKTKPKVSCRLETFNVGFLVEQSAEVVEVVTRRRVDIAGEVHVRLYFSA